MKARDVVAARRLTEVAMPVLIRKEGSVVGWFFEMDGSGAGQKRQSAADRISAVWEKFGRNVELVVAEPGHELVPEEELKFD